ATNAPTPASTVVETILIPCSACLGSVMSLVSLTASVGRPSSPRIRNKSRFAPGERSPPSRAALPRASLPFGADLPVTTEDDFWVRLRCMPEPFQVNSPLGDGGMSQITNRECAINRHEEKAGD